MKSVQFALQIISNFHLKHGVTQIKFSWDSGSVSSGSGPFSVKLIDSVSASKRVAFANSLALDWVDLLL